MRERESRRERTRLRTWPRQLKGPNCRKSISQSYCEAFELPPDMAQTHQLPLWCWFRTVMSRKAEPPQQMWKVPVLPALFGAKMGRKIDFNQMKPAKNKIKKKAWKSTNSDEAQTDPILQWDPLESAAQSKGFNAQKTFSKTETRTGVQLFPAKMILAANEPRLFFKKHYLLIMKISTGKINFQKAQKLTTEVHHRLICVKYEGRCCRHGTSHRNKDQFLTNTNRSCPHHAHARPFPVFPNVRSQAPFYPPELKTVHTNPQCCNCDILGARIHLCFWTMHIKNKK